jgi:hypothetical protein
MHSQELDVNGIADELFDRLTKEITTILRSQVSVLGEIIFDPIVCKRFLYPDDPNALATYKYQGKTILGVRIGETGMSLEFDIPQLTHNPEEEKQHERV